MNYTYNVVSRSPTYMLIVNVKHYEKKWLILASPPISIARKKMSPTFDSSIELSSNVFDLPDRKCLSNEFLN